MCERRRAPDGTSRARPFNTTSPASDESCERWPEHYLQESIALKRPSSHQTMQELAHACQADRTGRSSGSGSSEASSFVSAGTLAWPGGVGLPVPSRLRFRSSSGCSLPGTIPRCSRKDWLPNPGGSAARRQVLLSVILLFLVAGFAFMALDAARFQLVVHAGLGAGSGCAAPRPLHRIQLSDIARKQLRIAGRQGADGACAKRDHHGTLSLCPSSFYTGSLLLSPQPLCSWAPGGACSWHSDWRHCSRSGSA